MRHFHYTQTKTKGVAKRAKELSNRDKESSLGGYIHDRTEVIHTGQRAGKDTGFVSAPPGER